jgi:hypothetical protein
MRRLWRLERSGNLCLEANSYEAQVIACIWLSHASIVILLEGLHKLAVVLTSHLTLDLL